MTDLILNKKILIYIGIFVLGLLIGLLIKPNGNVFVNTDRLDKFINEDLDDIYKISYINDDTRLKDIRYLYNLHPVVKDMAVGYLLFLCS